MAFLEPAFLWSALAVAVPIAIHLWHPKRGRPLPWAAMRWLSERKPQQSRGLRLQHPWLLLLRCALLVLLAVMLAQPRLSGLQRSAPTQRVHVMQASNAVRNNFRFELEEARRQNEPVTETNQADNPAGLQHTINQLTQERPATELHLYLNNTPEWVNVPVITVPVPFRLHIVSDSARPETSRQPRAFLVAKDNRRIFVNEAGRLTSLTAPTLPLQARPLHVGPIHTLLTLQTERERQTVRAALSALTDVYGFAWQVSEKAEPDKRYDLVLTDQLPQQPNPPTLYIVTNQQHAPTADNVVIKPETFSLQTSTTVAAGQLPEWLGQQLLRHYHLTSPPLLSEQAFRTIFVRVNPPNPTQPASVQQALLLAFIVLLTAERWIALRKNL